MNPPNIQAWWDAIFAVPKFLKHKWQTERLRLLIFLGVLLVGVIWYLKPNEGHVVNFSSSTEASNSGPGDSAINGITNLSVKGPKLPDSKPIPLLDNRIAGELQTKQLSHKLQMALDRARYDTETERVTALQLFTEILTSLSQEARRDLDPELLAHAEQADRAGLSPQAVDYYKELFRPYAAHVQVR